LANHNARRNKPVVTPQKSRDTARSMNANLNILNAKPAEKLGTAKEPIPVTATIIINIGLTILAATAACPNINAPIMPNVAR
jgi:hypothetical protein